MSRLSYAAVALTLVALAAVAGPSLAAGEGDVNLNGVWSADDGGTYYFRQVGKTVWWLGMSSDNGQSWTNTFKGYIKGDELVGDWADVPRGACMGSGRMTLVFRIEDGRVVGIRRVRLVGDGFGGANWSRTN